MKRPVMLAICLWENLLEENAILFLSLELRKKDLKIPEQRNSECKFISKKKRWKKPSTGTIQTRYFCSDNI